MPPAGRSFPKKGGGGQIRTIDFDVVDGDRGACGTLPRAPPMDSTNAACPVILFSHGLGGSREGPRLYAEHWSGRGYVAVFLQRRGSYTTVWREKRPGRRMAAMQDAASLENFTLRIGDVPAVLDRHDSSKRLAGRPLEGRPDLEHVRMSGPFLRCADHSDGE